MNENLNLVEILKNCPNGTKLYSTVFGEVELYNICNDSCSIEYETKLGRIYNVTFEGKLFAHYNGECTLFPSKEQRDWSKFNLNKEKEEKKERFNPKTLQPFDKVLAREDEEDAIWFADFISQPYNESTKSVFIIGSDDACIAIPYNDETKHLIGTENNAPEYYRYWED